MNFPTAPKTIAELEQRIELMAGLTLGEIANELDVMVPEDLTVEKGWAGQLIEAYLGATAGNLPEPDFQHLGIELKTIPIDSSGKPLETTFVSVAPLSGEITGTWQDSTVYKKLNHVLWVPIIAERKMAIPHRQIATPFLWKMTKHWESELSRDWQELTDLIVFGHHDKINATHGQWLQLRPKAADSSVRTDAYDQQGNPVKAPPKGFYLRTDFTRQLLTQQFQLDTL
ncbi:MAG: DNA mismatch repair endonuclease MutH [Gammaproteobacteria bacterium]|nr:DNA mismatch repair endonuclease MutH [Gammaproteobacteria bacterium]